jgi:hypothetical protein
MENTIKISVKELSELLLLSEQLKKREEESIKLSVGLFVLILIVFLVTTIVAIIIPYLKGAKRADETVYIELRAPKNFKKESKKRLDKLIGGAKTQFFNFFKFNLK